MRFQAPESLSEQISQHLGQRIITGQLQPGDRIQELRIAGELDVSRGSVREALLILERRHLIEIFPRRGAVVSQLTPALVNSLYDVYIELLSVLTRRLMDVTSGSDLKPMIARFQELDQLFETGEATREQIVESGFDIMGLIHRIVENPFLEETLENFRPAISRTYFIAIDHFRGEIATTRRFFKSIADAAEARNSEELDAVIRQFGEHQRNLALKALAAESSGLRKNG
ncbi:GntR family transcriptional regulator [Marinobacter sp. 1Y8]